MVNICSQKYAYAAIDHEYGLATVMKTSYLQEWKLPVCYLTVHAVLNLGRYMNPNILKQIKHL